MFSSPSQHPQPKPTICSSLALCTVLLALAAAALDVVGAAASDSDGKLMVVPPHAIATRSNFLRFGKRSMEAAAPISEDGDDGDVSEAFEGPVRRDYREFVRFGKRAWWSRPKGQKRGEVMEAAIDPGSGRHPHQNQQRSFLRFGKRGGQMASHKRGQDYLRFGKKADYLRFGKRADYLRFGKRNYDGDGGDDYAEVNTEEEDDDVAKRQLWKRFSRLQRSNDFLRFG